MSIQHPEKALIQIDSILERARDARRQLEADIFEFESKSGFELPEAALEGFLREAELLLEVALEAADLPSTRLRLIEQWAVFEKAGITKTTAYPEVDYLESKPLDYLQKIVEGLRMVLGKSDRGWESYELQKLEAILRKTATILKTAGVTPTSEPDVQKEMAKYLDAYFPEYVKNVQIPGGITTFKPDAGIRNLKAAIEFKYAATRDEVSRSLRGIFEDVSGYGGSLDWTRFYSVVYQTEAFESEERFRHDLAHAGAISWLPILVTGKGSRAKLDAACC